MFDGIIQWCEEHGYTYEKCKNWCDCNDYTDYLDVYTPNYRFTLFLHDNGDYTCDLYKGKELTYTFTNFYTAKELIQQFGWANNIKLTKKEYDLISKGGKEKAYELGLIWEGDMWGYGIKNFEVYEKDNEYFMKYDTWDNCD